ncbi:probable protein phosphatase 2C 23 [Dendrobium catenatum]|uniref:protein-serine/threonine phosphatase n=1 Tax=Dendrobium catenatum TaxID=906689 RepID=A0A2I0WXI3_9ASPA|nr:probable protein phosphatase 2C 23 [Dendrobium catenatum]PKU80364.1 putative protein phosphatase 2C 23 [Dendrobium catenatum]
MESFFPHPLPPTVSKVNSSLFFHTFPSSSHFSLTSFPSFFLSFSIPLFSSNSLSSSMGNGLAKLTHCFYPAACAATPSASEPHDEGLGHSFCYVRPDLCLLPSSSNDDPTIFHSISGAAVSANAATALSTDPSSITTASSFASAAAFESSTSFFSVPLQPVPRFSGPLSDRGFLSGPIERSFLSGPLDKPAHTTLRRSRYSASSLLRRISRAIGAAPRVSTVAPKDSDSVDTSSSVEDASASTGEPDSHWAQGKAGEDRVHVVVSRGWVFVGIYDGFNGPDATDYLLSNLYPAIKRELNGLLCVESREFSDDCFQLNGKKGNILEVEHAQILKALSRALRKTEDKYLEVADKMMAENPELALMGSCVLVMLMRGKDVYLMNVGDSRAVLARTSSEEEGIIIDDALNDYGERMVDLRTLSALQLTMDHSTCVEHEVRRIKKEHQDDASAIANDRVKGYLKVTRAFGAGFLKQPKWNDALLKMFRIDYIGTSPYITCNPSLYHYKLSARDKFLILSSDGLYQYLTNDEVVTEVDLFISTTPEGDPAQHLVEEVLFRAAKKAGMDFHELLEIPQGDRRRYHDDVSVIVISLEGKIWRSFV